jgi:hypothetical protein
MIVYVATWPRCGNSVLRDLIALNLAAATTDGYMSEDSLNSVFLPTMRARSWVELDPDNRVFGCGERRFLAPGWLRWLTDELREELASDHRFYFLKTHEPPYPDYLPGESAIQMVRHPLAATWSWQEMIRDQGKKAIPSLVDICRKGAAGVPYGYSEYHEAWLRTTATVLRCRYEDHRADPESTVVKISEFLDLPARPLKIPDWAARNSVSPKRYKAGKINRWRGTSEDAEAVWAAAQPASTLLGYSFDPRFPDVAGHGDFRNSSLVKAHRPRSDT